MKTLKLEVESDSLIALEMALQEATRQLQNGCTSGDLRTEGIDTGWWEIEE